jgi:hypothetical protein
VVAHFLQKSFEEMMKALECNKINNEVVNPNQPLTQNVHDLKKRNDNKKNKLLPNKEPLTTTSKTKTTVKSTKT